MCQCGLDSSGSGYGPVPDSCEHSNEHKGSIGMGNVMTRLVTDFEEQFWWNRRG
jgi:hypothetical protein